MPYPKREEIIKLFPRILDRLDHGQKLKQILKNFEMCEKTFRKVLLACPDLAEAYKIRQDRRNFLSKRKVIKFGNYSKSTSSHRFFED